MPAMHFDIRWPDATQSHCYSPSLIIKDYFQPGQSYPLEQFVTQAREALHIASDRVQAKFGFTCSSAMDQLQQIEQLARQFDAMPHAQVQVLAFHE